MAPWPVVGHEWAVDLLAQAIRGGRPSHAYLFTGPAGVGKTTLARALAQALLCEDRLAAPCGVCRICQRVAQGRFPDLQLITAEKNTLQIDQVRALQTDAALAPLEGRYRIFILREIERATLPAANALLKTLEEPPPAIVLLLTTARRDLVLPTVLSRCQIIPLRPLPTAQIEAALQAQWGVEAERAALLARLSAGRLGWAVRAHSDPALWAERVRTLDDLPGLTGGGHVTRLAYAETLSRRPEAAEQTIGLWATWWRDLLLWQHGLHETVVNADRRPQLAQQATLFRQDQISAALADLAQAARRIRANGNLRLALDVLLLRLPRPAG
jgi:DNA polymerase-3 subunit delta'